MKVDFVDPAPLASEGYVASNSSGDLGASVRYFYSAGETPVEHLEDLVSIAALYSPGGEADYVLCQVCCRLERTTEET